jgi:hypothetical protein
MTAKTKGKARTKGKSRFPSGMTTKKRNHGNCNSECGRFHYWFSLHERDGETNRASVAVDATWIRL